MLQNFLDWLFDITTGLAMMFPVGKDLSTTENGEA
jgi:hypothetical protein